MKDSTLFYERHIEKLKKEYYLQVCDFENEVECIDIPKADFIVVCYSHFKLLFDSLKQMNPTRNIKVIYITRPYSKMPFETQNSNVERFEYEMSKLGVDKYIKGANVNKNVENLWEWIVSEEVSELKRR